MARRSACCFVIMLLFLSLFLNPALAKGKGKKHKKKLHEDQSLTLTPPPPPPPTDVLSPPTSDDVSGGSGHIKGHHGRKKKKHHLESPPTSSDDMPSLSPTVKDPVTRSLGLSQPPSMAPSLSESAVIPPAVSPAPKVSSSIALIVKSSKGKSFTDHICDLAANPKQCEKILEGKDKKYIESLPAGTALLLSMELSAAVASKAVLYMLDKMASNSIDPSKTTCIENYQDSIVGFTGAYANFTIDPTSAKQSLNDADVKIGLCETSLASGEPKSFLPQMDDTNKLLRSLIKLVLKEFSH